MLAIFESIVPIFLLVLAGVALRRMPMVDEGLWPGLETLGYYVLFPALLFLTLANADFSGLELGAISLTAFLSVIVMFGVLFALYRVMKARGVGDPSFTSVFQTATRWNGFVALAIAERYAGINGLTVVALVMAVNIIPLNLTNVGVLLWFGPHNRQFGSFVRKLATNPLILSCLAGLVMNIMPFGIYPPIEQAIDLLARSALGFGLLMVGAGLKISDALKPRPLVLVASALKLVLLPIVMIGLALVFGISGQALVLLAICSAVPTALNGYLLARQMGGDTQLYAAIATVQTAFSFLTLPAVIAIAEKLG